RAGKFGREIAAHGGDVDADLLEHLALHHPAHAAAGIVVTLFLALPFDIFEGGIAARLAFDLLESGADARAQVLEPCARLFSLGGPVGHFVSPPSRLREGPGVGVGRPAHPAATRHPPARAQVSLPSPKREDLPAYAETCISAIWFMFRSRWNSSV